jgi:hypothetical protein
MCNFYAENGSSSIVVVAVRHAAILGRSEQAPVFSLNQFAAWVYTVGSIEGKQN